MILRTAEMSETCEPLSLRVREPLRVTPYQKIRRKQGISIHVNTLRKITKQLELEFKFPPVYFKNLVPDDCGGPGAPRDVHLRHLQRPYAGPNPPSGQRERATLRERPHQLPAIIHAKGQPRPSG